MNAALIPETLRILKSIVRDHRGQRSALIRSCLLIQLRRMMGSREASRGFLETDFLNFHVNYFSDEALAILMREVFVEKPYYVTLTKSQPLIVDCGANIGMSVLLFKHLFPESEILAFEPDPRTFDALSANVATNDLADVRVLNKAVGETNGSVPFYYNPDVAGNLGMGFRAESCASLPASRSVDCVRLSDYITRPVDLLKLDIEGAENQVMRDLAARGKLELIDQIVMEYHHHMAGAPDCLSEILSILEENGFGYQLYSNPCIPFRKNLFSAMFVYAYKNTSQ